MKNRTCFPIVEPLRCHLTFCNNGEKSASGIIRVSCDAKSDRVAGTNRRGGTEQWYVLENCDERIRLVNCSSKKYLACDGTGRVSASADPIDGEELWNVRKPSDSKNDAYVLSSAKSGRCLYHDSENGEICTFQHVTSQRIKFEILSGELLFLSSPWAQKQLSLQTKSYSILRGNASPALSPNWEASSVWRFIEAGEGQICIMSWQDQTILTSDANGTVYTTTLHDSLWENENGSKWMVEPGPENGPEGVTLKSVSHGMYLQVGPDGVRTFGPNQGDASIWHSEAANRRQFFISCQAHDKRLTTSDANLDFKGSSNRGSSEVWQVENYQGGQQRCVSLKSIDRDKFLNADADGNLYETDSRGENGLWELCTIAHDNCSASIRSKASGGYLSCRSNGNLFTRVIAGPGRDEAWLLQPVLPGSVVDPRSKYLSLLGGSAVGMALGPLAVAGAVGAVGFGVGGIGAGTWAAWMMSLQGGATAAGGAVAALQSVGAAGLGATGMAASMSAGAVVGGSASAAARAVAGSNTGGSNGQDGDGIMHAAADVSEKTDGSIVEDISNASHHHPRPFCDWRLWQGTVISKM